MGKIANMKRKIFFVVWCVLLAVGARAQSEYQKELPVKENGQAVIFPGRMNYPIFPAGAGVAWGLPDCKEETLYMDAAVVSRLRLGLPSLYGGNRGVFPFYKKMFFYLEGGQECYLHLASYHFVYMALGWRLNGQLDITGGMLAVKEFTSQFSYGADRSGTRFTLRYRMTEGLDFNVWGQCLAGSSISSLSGYRFPQTGTGASMTLNFGGGSQVGVGTEYQYDERKEKWGCQSGGKLKLNF